LVVAWSTGVLFAAAHQLKDRDRRRSERDADVTG
jgi:hypothetical protein